MALWGVSDADESKPKWLSDADKKNCVAKSEGWVLKKAVGSRNLTEILVATGADLSTGIGQADITNIDFVSTAFDKSDGGTLSVKVIFNEDVTVAGTPQLTVVNDNNANHTLSYASGSTTNELVFSLAIGANNAATDAGDVLSIGANAVSLNGGTIVDSVGGGNATITNSGAIGTAAGTITVSA
tara:strand:+ start:2466 stop:3017 length:552 start_codon:yes stop_codon:yes gene_type:complete